MTRKKRKSPFDWPPGPERRAEMRRQGYNISPMDFTDEETAATEARIAAQDTSQFDWRSTDELRPAGPRPTRNSG